MKSLIACLAAVVGLAGCVAVPYYEPSGYYYGPAAPAMSFSYSYRDGGPRHHHGHRHRYRH